MNKTLDLPNKRLTKVERQELQAALVKTLTENFPILSESQVVGIANHFRNHMAPIISKTQKYLLGGTFGVEEMKNAFAEVLAKRILHIESLDEQPTADKATDEAAEGGSLF